MRKSILSVLTVSLLCSSVVALAQDLEEDMDILKGAYRSVQKTDNAAELKQALTDMRAAAEHARTQTPASLQGKTPDSTEMKEYRGGMDTLISQIDSSKKLAEAGNLKGAKAEAEKFALTRDVNHKKFR